MNDPNTNLIQSLALGKGPKGLTPGEQARIFRQAMGFPIGTPQDIEAYNLQHRLIEEEFEEWKTATDNANELHELADLVFVCFQLAALQGWDLDSALERVFIANMSKLGPDGKPLRRADGKVLKGPLYEPPDMTDLV
jgi:predicted HAD superfamily Cof-like phosphohydrolase